MPYKNELKPWAWLKGTAKTVALMSEDFWQAYFGPGCKRGRLIILLVSKLGRTPVSLATNIMPIEPVKIT
jgi:hypothetical protein